MRQKDPVIRPRLLLASASPRRRELLAGASVCFEVLPVEVEEWESTTAEPQTLVSHNAKAKAEAGLRLRPDGLILAADTTVAVGGVVLNKPVDLEEARRMLRCLGGRTHSVFTGVALVGEGMAEPCHEVVESRVRFHSLDEPTIDRYLEQVHVLDKAGAYAIQESSGEIVAGFEGSLTNIIGLPMERVVALLEPLGLVGRPTGYPTSLPLP